jgi:hypothetical protein
MLGGRPDFHAGEFIRELLSLVDQDGKALWADILYFALESQGEQGGFIFRAVAVQAGFFVLFIHGDTPK